MLVIRSQSNLQKLFGRCYLLCSQNMNSPELKLHLKFDFYGLTLRFFTDGKRTRLSRSPVDGDSLIKYYKNILNLWSLKHLLNIIQKKYVNIYYM